MANPAISANRQIWGRQYSNLPVLDLISVQKESFEWFLEKGIGEILAEISPISDFTGKNWELSLGKYTIGTSKITPKEAMEKGLNYDFPLKVECVLTNKQIGKSVTQDVFLTDIPTMTQVGTFIISGIERAVKSQLLRSSGVYFGRDTDPISGRIIYGAEIRPIHGEWLEFEINRYGVITVRLNRRRKFPVTTFLRALGLGSDEQLLSFFRGENEQKFILATIEKDITKGSAEAAMEIYRKMRPGEPAVAETALHYWQSAFFEKRRYFLGAVGRYKINKRLGLNLENKEENWVLKMEDLISTIKYLIKLETGEGKIDDIDHLANRRLRRCGELIAQEALRPGILRLERAIKERMSMLDIKEVAQPASVISARVVIAAINEFFRTGQLSAILDQNNILSELISLRTTTVMGPKGIDKKRASFSVRDINSSQYSRICPLKSPEGPNIGLVTQLALYSRVNEFGFIEAPYHPVKDGKISKEIVYLAADDEEKYYITHAGVKIKDNRIIDERVTCRHQGEYVEVPNKKVEFIDIASWQIISESASLIPFLAHDDGVRALMGSNMQAQSVPLIKNERPLAGTGMEIVAAEAMGWTVRVIRSGKVVYVDGKKVVIQPNKTQELGVEEQEKLARKLRDLTYEKDKNGDDVYHIEKFKRTNPNGTCFSQKARVFVGDVVKTGQIIIDGPGVDNGELALGVNLRVAYMAYDGLGYEDAIVVSDRLVKDDCLSSISIEEYEAELIDTKLGPEELTRDIPNVSEEGLANLDENGIVVVGAEVGPDDILVGKIAPKGETELTAEERLLRAIFGEKARDVRDTSLRMPHGEHGIVMDVNILDRKDNNQLGVGVIKLIKVKVASMRKVMVGDKLAGRHGNKGVISKIVPEADMPYDDNGRSVDLIISPISVLARMNLGQVLEVHLGAALERTGETVGVPAFEKIPEELIIQKLKEAGLPTDGKITLYDGRTGEPYEMRVVVGFAYILKLTHMVEDKTHARSTGPYSLVTQQPLGGKAQMGGQRLGEMEVWALEAHRAAINLQEMLTVKSDDTLGRNRTYEAIVKGVDLPLAAIPEGFKVLVKELQSLGLAITPEGVVKEEEKIGEEKIGEEKLKIINPEELAEASGAKVVATEEDLQTEKNEIEIEEVKNE